MKFKFLFLIVSLLFTGSLFSQESEANPFTIKWNNGFKVESYDKKFKLKFGGRIHYDHAYISQDSDLDATYGPLENNNGSEFRRARFFISGTVYKSVGFKLNVDFAGGVARLKDAYIEIKKIPVVGKFRVGHLKEPLRFDALTSSKYIVFMERGIPADFANERNTGFILMNDFLSKRLSVQMGVFRNSDAFGNDKNAGESHAFTGRVTGLIIDNKEKDELWHIGGTYSHRRPDVEEYKISVRPKSHLAPKYISTGPIYDIGTVHVLNFETAYTRGPFTFQGEFLNESLKKDTPGAKETLNFFNYYAQVSYFITGEHRPYKGSYANFGRVKPKNNFMDGGWGALEVALRYSDTNLNSGSITGGEQGDITAGVNWYLNPVTRMMFNYVHTNIRDAGALNVFQVRFQIDF